MDDANKKLARVSIFLRIGVAFVFLYAAVAAFVEPYAWIGYLPLFLRYMVRGEILLPMFSIAEIVLALWLLWGRWLFYSAAIASLMLIGIIFFNFGALDIVFRDVAILCSSAALMIMGWPRS